MERVVPEEPLVELLRQPRASTSLLVPELPLPKLQEVLGGGWVKEVLAPLSD